MKIEISITFTTRFNISETRNFQWEKVKIMMNIKLNRLNGIPENYRLQFLWTLGLEHGVIKIFKASVRRVVRQFDFLNKWIFLLIYPIFKVLLSLNREKSSEYNKKKVNFNNVSYRQIILTLISQYDRVHCTKKIIHQVLLLYL